LTIRIAANTGSFTDIKNGLKNIAKMFEKAAIRNQFFYFRLIDLLNIYCFSINSRVEDERVLFREVIQFDSAKNLSRLRSRHAKRTRKTRGDGGYRSNLRPLDESMDGPPLAFDIWRWGWQVVSGFRRVRGRRPVCHVA